VVGVRSSAVERRGGDEQHEGDSAVRGGEATRLARDGVSK
jgi:hypothetical protein